jgi:hypothetical protein
MLITHSVIKNSGFNGQDVCLYVVLWRTERQYYMTTCSLWPHLARVMAIY